MPRLQRGFNFMKNIMKKLIMSFLFFGLMLMSIPSLAQEDKILGTVSPKLRQFLQVHPEALQVLTNTVSKAFTERNVRLLYFYTDNESADRAYHTYPSESAVKICVRENQQPLDEFISLVFESLNSEGEKQFRELFRKAESGDISRTEFAQEILKVEFAAVKNMRSLLRNLKFSKKETSASYFYKEFSECPDDFKDFLSYIVKVSPHGDPIKGYEAKYDLLRKP